jgi:predicted ATPase
MIRTLLLKNFKCFEAEAFELNNLSILTGLNGMGKSTVVQALLLLRQSYELGLLQQEKAISLNGDLVNIGNARDLLFQFFQTREIEIEILMDAAGPAGKWILDGTDIGSDSLPIQDFTTDGDIFGCPLFTEDFHYLSAERIGPRVYYEMSRFNVVYKNQLGIRGEFAANYLAEFQGIAIPILGLGHPEATGSTLYEQVNAWFGEIRPGTRIGVTNNQELSLVGLNYQFVGGQEIGNKFRPTNVGFGLSYLLPILVAVLSSQPGSLIIVENPEAHLHPQGQAQIGRLLSLAAAHGVQVIVETHSDHILNGVRVAVKEKLVPSSLVQFYYFTGEVIENRFKHYVLTPKINDDGRISSWPDGFFDEWDKQLTRLL